jgi:hypothetical protein
MTSLLGRLSPGLTIRLNLVLDLLILLAAFVLSSRMDSSAGAGVVGPHTFAMTATTSRW